MPSSHQREKYCIQDHDEKNFGNSDQGRPGLETKHLAWTTGPVCVFLFNSAKFYALSCSFLCVSLNVCRNASVVTQQLGARRGPLNEAKRGRGRRESTFAATTIKIFIKHLESKVQVAFKGITPTLPERPVILSRVAAVPLKTMERLALNGSPIESGKANVVGRPPRGEG